MPQHAENNAPKPSKILVFDSGVGGLSVLREIHCQLPKCEYLFVSDNAGFPYGTRDEADLIGRVTHVMDCAIRSLNPDIAVVACNSASTVVLPILRERYAIPFVGVVPAVKPAAAISVSGHFGILATPATISRAYTEQLITDFASDCEVTRVGSSDLVYQAERKLRDQTIDLDLIATVLNPFFNNLSKRKLDTIVLACTHFPLLGEELAKLAPYEINWIDSGAAIARRVGSLLDRNSEGVLDIASDSASHQLVLPPHSVWTTMDDGTTTYLRNFLQPLGEVKSGVLPV